MQESKKHHHVPVFYLARWAGDNGKVNVVRNINGKIVRGRRTPQHLGFEYHLYSYAEEFDAADRAEIETKFFKRLDDAGARIIAKMINGDVLARRERILWAQFLLAMKVRTPENVSMIRAAFGKAVAQEMEAAQPEYAALRRDHDPPTAMGWLEANRPGLAQSLGVGQLPKLASNPQAMQDVLSFDWHAVDFGETGLRLITSDRPCVYTEGLNKPDCVIALPLSPRQAFFAFRPNSRAQRSLMRADVDLLLAALNESVASQAAARVYVQAAEHAPDEFLLRRLSASADYLSNVRA